MNFSATAEQLADGRWTLRHESAELGNVEATGATRDEAAEKLSGEIRYRLELCPCTGESYRHIEVEILANRP